MKTAAQSGDERGSLRTAAGLCLASPFAACVVLPDGRLHVFNETYRSLVSAYDGLTSFATPWGHAIPPAFAGALAGTSALAETTLGSDTVTLSVIPVREPETNVVCGVLVSVIKGAAGVA